MKAIWNHQVVAQSDHTVVVESNHYFPADSIRKEYFRETATRTHCPWKGDAHYYSLDVEGSVNVDAAWFYPVTKDKAKHIEGMVAFWRGVEVTS